MRTAEANARIVSLKPNITDILLRLGMGSELVGVTTYCTLPPELAAVPRIADYIKPNVERVAALHPTLVLAAEENSSEQEIEALRRMGMRVELLSFRSLAEITQSIRRIAQWVGRAEAGAALMKGLDERLTRLEGRARGVSPSPRLLFVVGQRPLVASGRRTVFQEFFNRLGFRNVLAESVLAYPQVSAEALVALDPDWIIDTSDARLTRARTRYYRESFPRLRAVLQGRIVFLPASLFLPGPPLWDGFEQVVNIVSPAPSLRTGSE